MERLARNKILLAILMVALAALLAACNDDSAGPETGADVEDVAQEEPVAEEPLEEEPTAEDPADVEGTVEEEATGETGLADEAQSFVGQQVTVSATISEVVSPAAFRIGGEDFGGQSLLVLSAPAADFTDLGLELDQELVDSEAVVQVTGTVRQFDIAEFEEEFGVDYDDAVFEPFEGENVIVADRVVTLTGQEVTVAGEVETVLSTVAFRLAGVGWDVLVLDAQQAAVSESDFVQVTGTVRRFDLATFEQEFGTDLDDALYEPFEGDLVLVAQSVQPAEQAAQQQ